MTPRPPALTIGIDPGGRSTGLVLVRGRDLLEAHVLKRHKDSPIGDLAVGLDVWRDQNIAAVYELLDLADAAAAFLAIEGIIAPNPHHRRRDGNSLTNLDGLLATAVVVGAVLDHWPGRVLIVPPGGNGSLVAAGYPEQIRPKSAAGQDEARHARSAYDVAIASMFLRSFDVAARAQAADRWPARYTVSVTTPR